MDDTTQTPPSQSSNGSNQQDQTASATPPEPQQSVQQPTAAPPPPAQPPSQSPAEPEPKEIDLTKPTTGPEGFTDGIETYTPEIAKSPEVQAAPETEPTLPKPEEPKEEPQEKSQQPTPPPTTPDADLNIVDKTEEEIQLHDLDDTRDKATRIADDEEEEFIKEVEAAHDRK